MPLTPKERAAAKTGDPAVVSTSDDGETIHWGIGERH